VKSLLSRPGFRHLLVGQGISALGDWMGTIAFMVLVHELTESSTAVGGVLVLRLVPAALAGPLATRAVAHWDRRRTMLAMDLARAAMIAVVPLVRGLWWLYLWAFLVEVASLVFLPARDSSIPDLAGEDDLPLANGLVLGSSYGTIPIGAGLFALVAALPFLDDGGIAGRPYALAFWLDAASYLVSFVYLSRLHQLDGGPPVATPGDVTTTVPSSFRGAFRIPLVQAVVPAATTAALGIGALFSLGIVFVRDVLGATDAEFGVLIAMFGVGAAGGVGIVRNAADDRVRIVGRALAIQGLVIAGMSLADTITLTLLGAAAFGATTAVTLAAGMSVLQDRLSGQERVLAFAAFHVVIRTGLSIAAMASGVAADVVEEVRWPIVGTLPPVRLVLFCSGLVVVAGSFLVQAGLRRPSTQ
jgi:MFS family permease